MKHKSTNTFKQGVRPEDLEDAVLLGGGVPQQQGIPYISEEYIKAQEVLTGVSVPSYDEEISEETPRSRCGAETKKGNPCQGWAVRSGLFCMVHDF